MVLDRFHVECRAQITGNTLTGHAAVFGQIAVLPTGYERMAPSAFNSVLANPDTDVRALLNHDPTLLLGRQSAGTLNVSVDAGGLAFTVDLPDTSYARDLRELVLRGDLTGASFGFVPGEDEFTRAPDGRQLRTHVSLRHLRDVSPVTFPAYSDATINLRHIEFEAMSHKSRLVLARAKARS